MVVFKVEEFQSSIALDQRKAFPNLHTRVANKFLPITNIRKSGLGAVRRVIGRLN